MNLRRPIIAVGLILAASSCQSSAPKRAKQQAHQHWSGVRGEIKTRLARQHLEAGRFEEAVAAAGEALALDPEHTPAYVALAKANLELSRAASAMDAIERAERRGLRSPDLHYLAGVILEQRGDIEQAMRRYGSARELNPKQIDFLTAEVECLVALGRAENALSLLDEHADRFDESATVAALGGHIAAMLGDSEQAVHRYRRALLVAGPDPTVLRALAPLLARTGRCAEAVELLAPILDRLTPNAEIPRVFDADQRPGDDLAPVRHALAQCHMAAGRPANARDVLADYAERCPDDVLAQVLLAKAALASGDGLLATVVAARAYQRDPDNIEVLLVRAAALWRQGDHDGAETAATRCLNRFPGDPDAGRLLAAIQTERLADQCPEPPAPQVSGPLPAAIKPQAAK